MGFDAGGVFLGLPFLSTISKFTDILLLLRINGDRRTMLHLKGFDLSGNVLRLLVTLWMLVAFLGLAIALQTVAHLPQ